MNNIKKGRIECKTMNQLKCISLQDVKKLRSFQKKKSISDSPRLKGPTIIIEMPPEALKHLKDISLSYDLPDSFLPKGTGFLHTQVLNGDDGTFSVNVESVWKKWHSNNPNHLYNKILSLLKENGRSGIAFDSFYKLFSLKHNYHNKNSFRAIVNTMIRDQMIEACWDKNAKYIRVNR